MKVRSKCWLGASARVNCCIMFPYVKSTLDVQSLDVKRWGSNSFLNINSTNGLETDNVPETDSRALATRDGLMQC